MSLVEPIRPRAHSAPSVQLLATRKQSTTSYHQNNFLNDSPIHVSKGYKHIRPLPRRSFANSGNSLTFQNDTIYRQRASTGRRNTRRQSTLQQHKENMELRCCRISVLLVIMQTFLGITITALGFYMKNLTLSIYLLETPFWAGVPLSLAGATGMYLCAYDFKAFAGNNKVYAVKCVCAILSTACVFVCLIGSVSTGIHGHRIASYRLCDRLNTTCICFFEKKPELTSTSYVYEGMKRCTLVFSSLKDYLILQCALNTVGSGVSLWFVFLLWKSRYRTLYGGLRPFYSYSANQPSHPLNSPYSPTSDILTTSVDNQQHSPITPKLIFPPSPVFANDGKPFNPHHVYARNKSIYDDIIDDSPVLILHKVNKCPDVQVEDDEWYTTETVEAK